MFRLLHDNGQQYGPISTDTLRQWIREGRAHARTQVQREGETDWKPLRDIPEVQADLANLAAPLSGASGASASVEGKSSGMAISSLILGILGFFTIGITSVIGLILGIVAIVRIGNSQGRLRGRGTAIAGMVTSGVSMLIVPVIAIFAAMLIPALAKAKDKAQSISCVNNMKHACIAVRIYAVDNDDDLPTANWCDLMLPELGSTNVLICPSAEGVDCGYAFNVSLIGKSLEDINPRTVMFFESDAGWNAVGGPELMIRQPRHAGVIVVGFVDGSVQQLRPAQLQSLHWEP